MLQFDTYSDKTAEIELDVKPIPHVYLEDTDLNCKTDLLDHDLNGMIYDSKHQFYL